MHSFSFLLHTKAWVNVIDESTFCQKRIWWISSRMPERHLLLTCEDHHLLLKCCNPKGPQKQQCEQLQNLKTEAKGYDSADKSLTYFYVVTRNDSATLALSLFFLGDILHSVHLREQRKWDTYALYAFVLLICGWNSNRAFVHIGSIMK